MGHMGKDWSCGRWMRVCVLLLLVTTLAGAAAGARIGVYPGTDYLGTIERGETVSVDLLLVDAPPGETATLQYMDPKAHDFKADDRNYPFSAENASQERIKDWVNLLDRRVELQEPTRMVVDGRSVEANARVTYLLHVPEDAEPGYHVGTFLPQLSSENGGSMLSMNALARHKFVFRVPGTAVRDVKILGFNGERIREDREAVHVVVQNSGTVTTTVGVDPRVNAGNQSVSLSHRGVRLSPGQVKTVTAWWQLDDVSTGRYPASATASWLTGQTENNGTITVTGFTPAVDRSEQEQTPDGDNLLIPVITMVLLVLTGREVWKRRKTSTDQQPY